MYESKSPLELYKIVEAESKFDCQGWDVIASVGESRIPLGVSGLCILGFIENHGADYMKETFPCLNNHTRSTLRHLEGHGLVDDYNLTSYAGRAVYSAIKKE